MKIIIKGWQGYGYVTLDNCHIKANEVKARNTTNMIWHKIYVTLWGRGHLVSSSKTVIPNPIPGVLTQTLGNIVGTWSAHWVMKVSVLFLRLCYSGITVHYIKNMKTILDITIYQQYEINLGRLQMHFLKNQINNV